MIGVAGIGLVLPLVSAYTYRRAGLETGTAWRLAALAVALSVGALIVVGLIYGFAVGVEAGLCGNNPVAGEIAGAGAYAVVASWAAIAPRRVWAWPFAVGAAIALGTLVDYFFAAAHGYCET